MSASSAAAKSYSSYIPLLPLGADSDHHVIDIRETQERQTQHTEPRVAWGRVVSVASSAVMPSRHGGAVGVPQAPDQAGQAVPGPAAPAQDGVLQGLLRQEAELQNSLRGANQNLAARSRAFDRALDCQSISGYNKLALVSFGGAGLVAFLGANENMLIHPSTLAVGGTFLATGCSLLARNCVVAVQNGFRRLAPEEVDARGAALNRATDDKRHVEGQLNQVVREGRGLLLSSVLNLGPQSPIQIIQDYLDEPESLPPPAAGALLADVDPADGVGAGAGQAEALEHGAAEHEPA
jgi:hypothetical protein